MLDWENDGMSLTGYFCWFWWVLKRFVGGLIRIGMSPVGKIRCSGFSSFLFFLGFGHQKGRGGGGVHCDSSCQLAARWTTNFRFGFWGD